MEKQSSGRRRCAFCGRTEDQVLFLIPSRTGLYICNECVEDCQNLIDEEALSRFAETFSPDKIPKPKEIKKMLDDYVIGQDDAKEVLSVAVYNHYTPKFFSEVAGIWVKVLLKATFYNTKKNHFMADRWS